MAKADKKDVDYSLGMMDSHCGKTFKDDEGYCRFYHHSNPRDGLCDKVSGYISPVYWCKLFKKKEG